MYPQVFLSVWRASSRALVSAACGAGVGVGGSMPSEGIYASMVCYVS